MIKINSLFQKLYVDTARFTETLDENIKTQIRQAAREWLKAVILKVPVWTGTSKASLQPLGAYLKVKVDINPVAVRKGYGLSEGRANQEFKFGREGNRWYFSFTEEVAHYLVNEYYNANVLQGLKLKTPGPYESFKAGERAFQQYIDEFLVKRVPNLKDFVYGKEVRSS